jgi:hypothetical protein
MKRNLVVIAFGVIGSLSLLMSQSTRQTKAAAAAAFPEGQWTVESKTDSTGVLYSTNGICIQAGGTWYATTSGQGSGHWYMKGARIHLHGNYAASLSGGAVNDSFELTVTNKKLLTGYLQEWNDSSSYNGYYTSKWTLASLKCDSPSK